MRHFQHPDFDQAILRAEQHFHDRGLRASIIEKDYFVTETLRLVALAAGDKAIFKGGTSISKGWNLIQRFSEDIDLFLDPLAFVPSLRKKGIDRGLKRLRDAVAAHPGLSFPTGGAEGVAPARPIYVRLSNAVTDVVGNAITDSIPGLTFGFFPLRTAFASLELPRPGGETFDLSAGMPGSLEDAERSGATWGTGRLARGKGGGSGRLGDLIVAAGETLMLNTDSTTFPLAGQAIDLLGNDVAGEHPGQGSNTTEITDGAFEFGHVTIEAGGILRGIPGTGHRARAIPTSSIRLLNLP